MYRIDKHEGLREAATAARFDGGRPGHRHRNFAGRR